jgi:hypothetical protein
VLSGVLYIYNRQWQYTELASFLIWFSFFFWDLLLCEAENLLVSYL